MKLSAFNLITQSKPPQCLFFKYNCVYLFIIFYCTGSLLLLTGFLQLQQVGPILHCGAQASHCGGFSCRAWALGIWDSVAAAHGLGSCGPWALLL